MIRHISQLTGMGVFQGFSTASVEPFNRQNLIYGYNGCGKTTLSLLFRALADRTVPSCERFPSVRFEIALSDGTAVTNDNVSDANLRVCTFNRTFVDENIDWNNAVKNVLLVAKESIADEKRLSALRADMEILRADIKHLRERHTALEKQCDGNLVSCAKRIKTSFQVIDTSDTWYFNYNRARLVQLIRKDAAALAGGAAVISDEEVAALTMAARPDLKQSISFVYMLPPLAVLLKVRGRIVELVGTTIASASLRRLAEDPVLQSWVFSGLAIHEARQVEQCEFCGCEISSARWRALRQHFSDDFKDFKNTLTRALEWLHGHTVSCELGIGADAVYQEWRNELEALRTELAVNAGDVNAVLESWSGSIREKESNPFAMGVEVLDMDYGAIERLSDTVARIHALVARHNEKTASFLAQTTDVRRRLERHYASLDLSEADYFANIERCRELELAIGVADTKLQGLASESTAIEATIVSERLGAHEFSKSLHQFLGRDDISLHYNETKRGYDIVRGCGQVHDGNLSEGERTAIAFVLFVTKLRERGSRVEDTIVVVDDPVSSFDSAHLFKAFAFLQVHCEKAKQLFVLTHNFTYFKLVRDWLQGRNRNRVACNKPPSANFYLLEARSGRTRTASLVAAGRDLLEYQTEYHYLFGRLARLRTNAHLSAEEAYLAANLTRKLLETFFGFKFPKGHGEFHSLLKRGQKACNRTTPQAVERVYRFVNRYSHSRAIEVADESLENLLGETPAVIADVLAWIEEVDPIHFAEMMEVLGARDP